MTTEKEQATILYRKVCGCGWQGEWRVKEPCLFTRCPACGMHDNWEVETGRH